MCVPMQDSRVGIMDGAMTERTLKVLMFVLVFCVTTSAFGLEVSIKYERHADGTAGFRPSGVAPLQVTADVPSGDWKLPELKSKPPIYAITHFGEKPRLLILDRQNASDFFYNRLYFDSNGNGDLTDDAVLDGDFSTPPGAQSEAVQANFRPLDTSVEVGGKALPYSFAISVQYLYFGDYGRPDKELKQEHIDQYFTLSLAANCSYSGEFQLDGQSYRVALGDRNVNGRFHDDVSLGATELCSQRVLFPHGDDLYLTTGREPGLRDAQVFSDLLLLNGKLYRVSMSAAQGKLTLAPTTEKLLPLKLPMASERMTICTEDASRCLMMFRPGTEVMVPKGKYQLLDYTVVRRDAQGDEWFLSAKVPVGGAIVTVEEGKDAVLTFGEPYVPMVQIPAWIQQGLKDGDVTDAQLSFAVRGAGKELLTDLERITGKRTRIPLAASPQYPNRPKEPAYRIVKADGEVVTQGDFEYG
jgi:hypothetical protein